MRRSCSCAPSGKPLTSGVPGLFTRDGYHKGFQENVGTVSRQLAEEQGWVLNINSQAGSAANLLTDKVANDVRAPAPERVRRGVEDLHRRHPAAADDERVAVGAGVAAALVARQPDGQAVRRDLARDHAGRHRPRRQGRGEDPERDRRRRGRDQAEAAGQRADRCRRRRAGRDDRRPRVPRPAQPCPPRRKAARRRSRTPWR